MTAESVQVIQTANHQRADVTKTRIPVSALLLDFAPLDTYGTLTNANVSDARTSVVHRTELKIPNCMAIAKIWTASKTLETF